MEDKFAGFLVHANYLSYIYQDHLPKDLDLSRAINDQEKFPTVRFSSQVTLGCVKLIIKANLDTA